MFGLCLLSTLKEVLPPDLTSLGSKQTGKGREGERGRERERERGRERERVTERIEFSIAHIIVNIEDCQFTSLTTWTN